MAPSLFRRGDDQVGIRRGGVVLFLLVGRGGGPGGIIASLRGGGGSGGGGGGASPLFVQAYACWSNQRTTRSSSAVDRPNQCRQGDLTLLHLVAPRLQQLDHATRPDQVHDPDDHQRRFPLPDRSSIFPAETRLRWQHPVAHIRALVMVLNSSCCSAGASPDRHNPTISEANSGPGPDPAASGRERPPRRRRSSRPAAATGTQPSPMQRSASARRWPC